MTRERDTSMPDDLLPTPDQLDQEAREWLRLLSSGRVTQRDMARIKQWRDSSEAHLAAWNKARRTWRDLGDMGEVYRAQHPASAAPVPRPARRRFVLSGLAMGGAVAAAAVVAVPSWRWPGWREWDADYRTDVGEQRQVALKGDLRVLMNTRTSLAVKQDLQGSRVEVLEGEAAFAREAATQPLLIVAGAGRIHVGAADLTVQRLGDDVCVTCLSGDVDVSLAGTARRLPPGEQLRYRQGEAWRVAQVDPEAVSAWRQGAVVFNDLPLAAAIEEINRYRPGRVILLNDTLAARRLSGRFAIGEFDVALAQIQQLLGARLRNGPGGLVFVS